MSQLTYPYNFQPDTYAKSSEVMAMFNAVKTLLNVTGLTDENIKAAAAIAYSKLDLAGKIVGSDLASGTIPAAALAAAAVETDKIKDGAVTSPKLALTTQTISLASNTSVSGSGAAIAGTQMSLGAGRKWLAFGQLVVSGSGGGGTPVMEARFDLSDGTILLKTLLAAAPGTNQATWNPVAFVDTTGGAKVLRFWGQTASGSWGANAGDQTRINAVAIG